MYSVGQQSTLVQVMACCLFGARPLPESMWICLIQDPTNMYSVGQQSTLVQVMACCLFGAKPLPEPVWTCLIQDPSKITYMMRQKERENNQPEISGIYTKSLTHWPLRDVAIISKV